VALAEVRTPRARVERFLFAPVAARPAAAFRVALAVALAVVFWPPWVERPAPGVILAALGALGILLVLFALGVRTRLTGLVLAAMLLPLVSVPGRQKSRQVMLFVLTALSVGTPRAPATGPMWPIRLIQLQLTALYGVNAIAKSTPAFLGGDVLVGMAEMLPNFVVDLSDRILRLGPLAIPVALAAPLGVAVEYVLAVAFWFPRLRWPAAALGCAFHASLSRVVRIGVLDVASIFLYLAFLLPLAQRERVR
jgi:hypothetical protein